MEMECSCFHSRIKSNPFFLAWQRVEVKSLPVPGKTVPLLSLGENSNSKISSVKVYWCHLTDTGENKRWHLSLDLSAFHFTLILVIVGSSVLPAPSHKVVNQPPFAHKAEGLEHSEPALPPGEGWRKLPRVVFNLEPLKSRFCQAWWCMHLIPNLGAEVGRSQNLRSIWNTKLALDQPELHNETLPRGGRGDKKVDSMN